MNTALAVSNSQLVRLEKKYEKLLEENKMLKESKDAYSSCIDIQAEYIEHIGHKEAYYHYINTRKS